MELSDKKKVATFIGVAAQAVNDLQASAFRLEHLRTLWGQHNPDVTGTPLEGHVADVSAWIDAVRAVADNAVANGLVEHAVPTHRNMALGEII